MTGRHYVACTVMAKDEKGRIAFLVKKKEDGFILPTSRIEHNKTGMACIIENLKEVLTFNVSNLELSELTNAVVKEESIPLFVFTYSNEETKPLQDLLKKEEFSWQYSETLYHTLEDWQFTGVPQF